MAGAAAGAAWCRAEAPTPSAEELLEFLEGRVARWWLPERWTFVDEVPKTIVGKFDKKVLRAQYAEGELEVVTVEIPATADEPPC